LAQVALAACTAGVASSVTKRFPIASVGGQGSRFDFSYVPIPPALDRLHQTAKTLQATLIPQRHLPENIDNLGNPAESPKCGVRSETLLDTTDLSHLESANLTRRGSVSCEIWALSLPKRAD
jgi:hypothetical protein